jgi:hypothetical protein
MPKGRMALTRERYNISREHLWEIFVVFCDKPDLMNEVVPKHVKSLPSPERAITG